jgi:nicotinate-nucleotide adenylyltransferase
MRVAFFGGSFDPPHRGHVALVRAAIDRVGLDRVVVAPVGAQPLKQQTLPAGFADRLAMARLAFAGIPRTEVSTMDAPRPDGRPNYSIDTLYALRAELPVGARISNLMGADSFLSIGMWHRAQELLLACDWIVASRPGSDLGDFIAVLPDGIAIHPVEHSAEREVFAVRNLQHQESQLIVIPDLAEDISATDVRDALASQAEGRELLLRALLPPQVMRYIADHDLYRQSEIEL